MDGTAVSGMSVASGLCPSDHYGLVYRVLQTVRLPPGISCEDVLQEGFMALVRGCQLYDCNRSMPSTYLYRCIRNAMVKCIKTYLSQKCGDMEVIQRSSIDACYLEEHRAPTCDEIEIIAGYLRTMNIPYREELEALCNAQWDYEVASSGFPDLTRRQYARRVEVALSHISKLKSLGQWNASLPLGW